MRLMRPLVGWHLIVLSNTACKISNVLTTRALCGSVHSRLYGALLPLEAR
jgi:hypothetical protein